MASTGVVTIEDAGSTNGVYVNGTKRQIATVTAGDSVRLGAVEYRAASRATSAADALISTSLEIMAFGDLQGLLDRVLDRAKAVLEPDRWRSS